MKYLEILVEGAADGPTIREILQRRFAMVESVNFRIHAHKGKGTLPKNPHKKPEKLRRGLLDLLPATLKGFANLSADRCVIVLVDADKTPCVELKQDLLNLYGKLGKRPCCALFRIAVEEIESWFIADPEAIRKAYPKAKISLLTSIPPDDVVGASELLARALGRKPEDCTGADKYEWATRIAPNLNLETPRSPSLNAFITGISNLISQEGQTK
ncbi:MAG: DUF4276 family protein [Blastocatellia bacterium]|nr:DUF4276 family protein [Blastocatellia bacterium]